MFENIYNFFYKYFANKNYYYSFCIYLPINHLLDNPIHIYDVELNKQFYSDAILFDKKTNMTYFNAINTNEENDENSLEIFVKSISYYQEMYFPEIENTMNKYIKFIYENTNNYNISNITGFTYIKNNDITKKIFCPIEFGEYSKINENKYKILCLDRDNQIKFDFITIHKVHFKIKENKNNEYYDIIQPIYLYKPDTLLYEYDISLQLSSELESLENIKLVINNPYYKSHEKCDDYEFIDYNQCFYYNLPKKECNENECKYTLRLPYKTIQNIYITCNNHQICSEHYQIKFQKIKKYNKYSFSPEIQLLKKQIIDKKYNYI
jgi:hypothetical protein